MSISIESAATARDGVTLVTAIVRNESDADRRVRIENELDGVVRPPRLDGVAADGWDVDGFEGVVAKRGTLALGYACGGAPSAEPCRVAWTEKSGARPSASTVADAVRDLADPRPPAAGVPHGGGNAPPIPPAVTAWLDGLEGRIEAGATSEDEWRALAAVGERIGALAGRA